MKLDYSLNSGYFFAPKKKKKKIKEEERGVIKDKPLITHKKKRVFGLPVRTKRVKERQEKFKKGIRKEIGEYKSRNKLSKSTRRKLRQSARGIGEHWGNMGSGFNPRW